MERVIINKLITTNAGWKSDRNEGNERATLVNCWCVSTLEDTTAHPNWIQWAFLSFVSAALNVYCDIQMVLQWSIVSSHAALGTLWRLYSQRLCRQAAATSPTTERWRLAWIWQLWFKKKNDVSAGSSANGPFLCICTLRFSGVL